MSVKLVQWNKIMPNDYNETFAGYVFDQLSLDFWWAMESNDYDYGNFDPLWSENFRDFCAMCCMMSV